MASAFRYVSIVYFKEPGNDVLIDVEKKSSNTYKSILKVHKKQVSQAILDDGKIFIKAEIRDHHNSAPGQILKVTKL